MRVCAYCGSTVGDDVVTCPHCSAAVFKEKCPVCGSVTDGSFCPHCASEREREQARAREEGARDEAVANANSGLGWKTALTVFLPFVGGYFLIDDNVRTGFRVFGIAWCALLAVSTATGGGGSAAASVLGSLLCLAPIARYLFRSRESLLAEGNATGKAWIAAFGVLLVYVLAGSLVTAGAETPAGSEGAAES